MSTLKFNRWQSIDGVTRNAVLQVVSKEVTTDFSTTSVTFVDVTDMFLAITPTSATSKIYVMYNCHLSASRSANSALHALRVMRNGSEVFAPYTVNSTGRLSLGISSGGATSMNPYDLRPIYFLDSPGTTSETTYQLQACLYVNSNSGNLFFNSAGATSGSFISTITLMEIAQ